MSIQFINRLKSVMAEHKISQTELAKRTGISQSSISDWLNNRYEPKQDKVYLLANALNVSPAWLLGYDEPNPHQVQSMSPLLRQITLKAITPTAKQPNLLNTYAHVQGLVCSSLPLKI